MTETIEQIASKSRKAFLKWRNVPAPIRGNFVKALGRKFEDQKEVLARTITAEIGKTYAESLGEVQEVIDICDFAVGLSRQLHGLTIASERPDHRLMEQWHPLGPVGVISAFNFPMAVWAWNAMIAFICGDSVIWKPSEKAETCAQACQAIVKSCASKFSDVPDDLSLLVFGGPDAAKMLADNKNVPLISATGSVKMGREIGPIVAGRFGRSILELGGNNAAIVAPSANLDEIIKPIVFSAIGTSGQRCTTLRRLIVHESIYQNLLLRLQKAYESLIVGDPHDPKTHVGPLIDDNAITQMMHTLHGLRKMFFHVVGGKIVDSEKRLVSPAIIEMGPYKNLKTISKVYMENEVFAPILYVTSYKTLDEAIEIQNSVPQGLSSAIFTNDAREAEIFCSPRGSDCGIANVNIGTSGAEVGGAFGGEKETGGGRESGSDAWKAYMRRQTNTINYSRSPVLAQGINFEVDF